MIRAVSLGIFLALALVLPVYAQLGLDFGSANVSLSITPEHPAPGNTVRITAQSSSIDLRVYDLAWYANGKKIAGGAGLLETDVVAGLLGSEMNVEAVVSSAGVETASAQAIIRPVEIDLLWESDSYVPAFYRGRALPSAGTGLHMEALVRFKRPNGSFVPQNEILYTWRKNGYVIQSISGRGKSYASIGSPPLFGGDVISVDVESLDGDFAGSASVRVPSVEPELMLYENHPLFGIMYHRALGAQTFAPQTEMTFAAVPYFAEAGSPDDGRLTYAWRVNGNAVVNDPARGSEITINAENSSGLALIQLALSSVSNFFLSRSGSWAISLGGSAGGTSGANLFQGNGQ